MKEVCGKSRDSIRMQRERVEKRVDWLIKERKKKRRTREKERKQE